MGAFGASLRGPWREYHFRYWAGVSKKPSWSGCKQPAGLSASQYCLTCTLVCQDLEEPPKGFQGVSNTMMHRHRAVRSGRPWTLVDWVLP